MTCDHCVYGLLIQEWTDAPHDFAVCLCDAGQVYRRDTNEGHRTVPLWRVWCAVHQVDPSRVFLLEEIYTGEELTAAGLTKPPVSLSREAALLAKGLKVKR
jgi:hypothetical protein